MKIFITGGTGFIGFHVLERLAPRRGKVLVLTSNSSRVRHSYGPNIKFLEGNLADVASWRVKLASFRPGAALHLAWEGIPDFRPSLCARNLGYGLELFQTLAEIGCKKWVAAGTVQEYGELKGRASEGKVVKPANLFAETKIALSRLGSTLAKECGATFLWARLFYVYGPGQRSGSLLPYLLKCRKQGLRPDIRTPHAQNDFVYAGDAADALVALLRRGKRSGIYNIGSGKLTPVKKIIRLIYGQELISSSKTDPGVWADIRQIRKETGWSPKISIERGIKNTLSWYATTG